jgi:hypothetical protein
VTQSFPPATEWGQDRDVVRQPLRSNETLHEPIGGEVGILESADRHGEEPALELRLVHLTVAGDEHRDRRPCGVEQDALQHLRGRPPQERRHLLVAAAPGWNVDQRPEAWAATIGGRGIGLGVGEVVPVGQVTHRSPDTGRP